MTGILSRVSVFISNHRGLPASSGVNVRIAKTVPDPTLRRPSENIGSGTIPLSAIPPEGSPGWVDVDITGAPVIAGTMYAILLEESGRGEVFWYRSTEAVSGDTHPEEYGVYYSNVPWDSHWGWELDIDMTFRTYVLPDPQSTIMSPFGITPCSNGVCPGASGGFTPADLTEGVKSHFQFQERPNGTVHGILIFSDPRPDGIELRGCTTASAACALTVTTLACTGTQSMTIAGTFTPRGGATTDYRLTLSEPSGGPGTFSLTAGEYTYTMTPGGIVNVTCPPTEK